MAKEQYQQGLPLRKKGERRAKEGERRVQSKHLHSQLTYPSFASFALSNKPPAQCQRALSPNSLFSPMTIYKRSHAGRRKRAGPGGGFSLTALKDPSFAPVLSVVGGC
jgi:hypothetical protein